MQLCITVNKKTHPNIINKVSEIKGRGGSISGELATMLENMLGDDVDKIDKMGEILEKMAALMSGATITQETVPENTQGMIGSMNFGFAEE